MLRLVGWLYGRIINIRNSLYDRGVLKSHSLGARTISIGNITTGGTGKTPLVAYVAELLADAGEKVCILTRGYGRESSGRVLVSDGNEVLVDAREGGDEPVELARKLIGKAIVVADADRVSAAAWAKENFGVTAFVLDDGFQHRRAKRDIDIVCVDATNPRGGERLLPAGTLRESFRNIARADAVVITRTDLVSRQIERLGEALTDLMCFVPATQEELDRWYLQAQRLKTNHLLVGGLSNYVPHYLWHYLSDADIRMKDKDYAEMQSEQVNLLLDDLKQPVDTIRRQVLNHNCRTSVFASRMTLSSFRSMGEFESDVEGSSWGALRGDNNQQPSVLAFCAVGNPEAFFAQLSIASNDKFDLSLTHSFPDHHYYTQSDISMLEEKARNVGANALLTTAKDAVKLEGLTFALPCYVLGIAISFDDPDRFRDLVLSA